MKTQEIVTIISVLILIGLAVTLYLMKNAPLDPDEEPSLNSDFDLTPKLSLFDIVIPILVVVTMIIVLIGLYQNPI